MKAQRIEIVAIFLFICFAIGIPGCSSGYFGSLDELREKAEGTGGSDTGNGNNGNNDGKIDVISALYRDDDGKMSIIAMNVDGSGRKWLYKDIQEIEPQFLSIGSDGKTLLFTDDNGLGIYSYNIGTKNLTKLSPEEGEWYYSSIFSPDMSKVYTYFYDDDNDEEIFAAIDMETKDYTALKTLNPGDYYLKNLSFTADGKIVGLYYGDYNEGIALMDTNGVVLDILKASEAYIHYDDPFVIPSLDMIMYTRYDERDQNSSSIRVMSTNGSGDTELVFPSTGYFYSPSVNAQGTKIVYSFNGSAGKIMSANFHGASLSAMAHVHGFTDDGHLIWSPKFMQLDSAVYAALDNFNHAYKDFSWYNNTSGSNYTISSVKELTDISIITRAWADDFSGKTITMCAGINLSSVDNWKPIGNFNGTFDGNNRTISYMKIAGSTYYSGLFNEIWSDGTVKNLTLANVTIDGSDGYGYIGALVGRNNGTVKNIIITNADIKSTASYVGGLTGYNCGTIQNCYVQGTVSASGSVGGIVGSNSGIVENCYTDVAVSGNYNVGGIASSNYSSDYDPGIIRNCFTLGEVSGTSTYYSFGGIVGSNSGTVENCVALGEKITISGGGYGYRIGYNGTYSGCYANSGMLGYFTSYPGAANNGNGASVSPGEEPGQYNNPDWWSGTVNFRFGEDDDNPWQMTSGYLPWLHFQW